MLNIVYSKQRPRKLNKIFSKMTIIYAVIKCKLIRLAILYIAGHNTIYLSNISMRTFFKDDKGYYSFAPFFNDGDKR